MKRFAITTILLAATLAAVARSDGSAARHSPQAFLAAPFPVTARPASGAWSIHGLARGPRLNVGIFSHRHGTPVVSMPPGATCPATLFSRGFCRAESLWGLVLSTTLKGRYMIGITAGTAFRPMAKYGNRDTKIKVRHSAVALSMGYIF